MHLLTPRRLYALVLLGLCGLAARLPAQQSDSGRVHVTVQESMGMLAGFLVQSAGRSSLSDSTGVARLVLPVGRQLITVTRTGFTPARVTALVVRDSIVTVLVTATMSTASAASSSAMGDMAMPMAEVRVTAARTERLAGDSPNRVEVVDQMEVDEKTLMAPSGISMLLNETPGLRVQAAAPGLGTGSVRILGLPGQYTVMLADGLPLYGASASALGPLDISPVDLQRVEIIKGAASALYGGQALGGVINLVSKPPTGRSELLLNRRTMGVTDGATWLSHRFGTGVGVSLLGAGTTQTAQDIDDDGWADQSRASRWSVRPRLHAVDARGRSLFLTAGVGLDDRAGGTFGEARAPDGMRFREALRSVRTDIGGTARLPLATGNVSMRFAVADNARQREFGTGPREDDRNTTGFLELTRAFDASAQVIVLGGVLQLDDYTNTLNTTFDHRWVVPGAFVTAERVVGPATLSASVRADVHPDAGTQLTERVALLVRPVDGWTVRGNVGTGYAAATGRTEETEAIGLRRVRITRTLDPERSIGAMLDVNGSVIGAEVLVTAYGSRIADAMQLADVPGSVGQTTLQNAAAHTRVSGVEALAVWRFAGGKFIANYGHARGSRPDALTGAREALPLLPRHRVGGDLMLERPGVYRMGIEGTWYGVQALDDNPYRTESKPYVYVMAIAAKQFGPVELVANFENLLNVRQTDMDPLVRRAPGMGGRWTTDVWAPVEGFMANVALRYRWR